MVCTGGTGSLSPHATRLASRRNGKRCCDPLAAPLPALQECCLCTSPGFSSAFVLLLVQTGESPVCLQPECEIPNGNRPSSQQGQHVPFGLT